MIRSVTTRETCCSKKSPGGDEFMVLMVLMASPNKDSVLTYANHIREKIASTGIMVPMKDTPIHLTISGGLAMCPADGQSTTELLRAADNALYEAKRKGGNRILPVQSIALDGSSIGTGGAEQDNTGSVNGEEET